MYKSKAWRDIENLQERQSAKGPRGPSASSDGSASSSSHRRELVAGLWRLRACPPRDLEDFARKAGVAGRRTKQQRNDIETTSKCKAAEAASCSFDAKAVHSLHIFTLFSIFAGSCWSLLRGLNVMMWWFDDVWCFICNFTAIAVNSCASACIAIMAMLEESTS